MKNLIAAIRDVQSELNAPKSRWNQFGKYHYRSCEDILDAVKPLLKQRGLALTLTDSIELVGTRYYVKATVEVTDGEHAMSACAYAREPDAKKGMDESQITGTASSYARKYALNGLFCIDDQKDVDTNEAAIQGQNAAAKQPAKKPEQQPAKKPEQQPAKQQPAPIQRPAPTPPTCEACGQPIRKTQTRSAEEVASETHKHYGMCLCTSCARDYQKSIDSAGAEA